ncbi:hypothetical protein [Arenimonas sp. MALMAid1274]|uniref:HD domain-containing protein n=1 Tax=Arenimonas sp. MALMAid1274 TaxID=3411630 RepID=UPI003B9EB44A
MSPPPPLPADQQRALEQAYATPPRAYHHFGHVQEVLARFDEVAAGPGWHQPDEVRWAILYHDAIYEAGRRDNEARSADLALEHLRRWPPPQALDGERVAALIRLTAAHGRLGPEDVDREAALFLDCDMAILGASAEAFAAYDRAIASEYRGKVPGFVFRLNRRRFLKALLAKPRIYLSDFFHERLDAAARNNLRRAINHKQ